jgi:hypothetical protein
MQGTVTVSGEQIELKTIQDAKLSRDRYWQSLYEMRQEYMSEFKGIFDLTVRPTMHYWAEQKYGFKMGLDGQGNYTSDYTVVNPKKFMLYQIKYWK